MGAPAKRKSKAALRGPNDKQCKEYDGVSDPSGSLRQQRKTFKIHLGISINFIYPPKNMQIDNTSGSFISSEITVSRNHNTIPPILAIAAAVLFALIFSSPQAFAQEGKLENTLFLPLKINAPTEKAELTRQSDQALNKILEAKGSRMKSRAEAEAQLDYDAWPPTIKSLLPLTPTTINYVAAGSLTRLGNKISIDIVVLDLLDESSPSYFYIEADSIEELDLLTEKIVEDILAYTGREFLIATIEVKGNERTDTGAIMRHIRSQPGDPYDPSTLRNDLKDIFRMGYFEDVQIEVTETDKGKEVIFRVEEKAVINQVLIEGENELDEKDIKEVISLSTNTIINPKEVQAAVSNIQKLYKDKGFYNTEVTADLTYPKPDNVNITFVIQEGFKVFIKEIRIVGNEAFKDKELKKVIETSEKGLLSWITESGRLKRDIVEQDAGRITAFYHNNGYIDARVSDPEIVQEDKWLYVTFSVSEGERYRVGTIELTGDLIEDKNDLLSYVNLGKEQYFSRQTLRDDILRLTDRYAEKGFAFAEAKPLVQKNVEHKRMDVTIDMQKGVLVYVNRIVIKGNTRTRDKVIRREMQIKEKGIFDASALRKSNERLSRLDYFEEINITPEPTAQEDLMNILVEVKEKPTGTFSIGGGYSTVDKLMFIGEISQNNFLGKGQRLAFQANLSSSNVQFNLNFTEPRLNDSKLLFGFDAYNWEREYDDYTKDSTGFALRFAYPLWEKWRTSFGYGFDDTNLEDVRDTASIVIRQSQDINITSYVKVGLFRDTRNRLYDASKGSQHSFSVKQAGSFLGGDSAFTKLEGLTSWYFPLPLETTFHAKGAIGYVLENEEDKLPIYEKFFLGGLNTVRGFDNGKISPVDPITNERIGGEKMWYFNFEFIFPLLKEAGLKGLVFFDSGNVYDESETYDIGDMRSAVGFGFRWLSPMGPLRLEWGYNIDPEPDEDQGVWDFSIGGQF